MSVIWPQKIDSYIKHVILYSWMPAISYGLVTGRCKTAVNMGAPGKCIIMLISEFHELCINSYKIIFCGIKAERLTLYLSQRYYSKSLKEATENKLIFSKTTSQSNFYLRLSRQVSLSVFYVNVDVLYCYW